MTSQCVTLSMCVCVSVCVCVRACVRALQRRGRMSRHINTLYPFHPLPMILGDVSHTNYLNIARSLQPQRQRLSGLLQRWPGFRQAATQRKENVCVRECVCVCVWPLQCHTGSRTQIYRARSLVPVNSFLLRRHSRGHAGTRTASTGSSVAFRIRQR